MAAADDIPLSTAYGRETAYIAIHMPPGVDHGRTSLRWSDSRPPSADVRTGERCTTWTPRRCASATRASTSSFGLRDRLDPHGTFGNDYLDRVLGAPAESHS